MTIIIDAGSIFRTALALGAAFVLMHAAIAFFSWLKLAMLDRKNRAVIITFCVLFGMACLAVPDLVRGPLVVAYVIFTSL